MNLWSGIVANELDYLRAKFLDEGKVAVSGMTPRAANLFKELPKTYTPISMSLTGVSIRASDRDPMMDLPHPDPYGRWIYVDYKKAPKSNNAGAVASVERSIWKSLNGENVFLCTYLVVYADITYCLLCDRTGAELDVGAKILLTSYLPDSSYRARLIPSKDFNMTAKQ